jgi:hypothetical protein
MSDCLVGRGKSDISHGTAVFRWLGCLCMAWVGVRVFLFLSNEFNGFGDKIRFFMMWLGAWYGWHLHSPSERMKGLAVLWIDTLPCL